MTAPKVRTDHEALKQIATNFATRSDSTAKATQNIKAKLGVLQGGDWVGKGATKFYNEMNSAVLPSLNRLTSTLAQAAMTAGKISLLMREAEREAAGLFRESGGEHHDHDHDMRHKAEGDGNTMGKYGFGPGADLGGALGQATGMVLGLIGGATGNEEAIGRQAGSTLGNMLNSVFNPDPRAQAVLQHMLANNGQAAVDEAIKQYNINVESSPGGPPLKVVFDPTLEIEGNTNTKGEIRIGFPALNSPGWLGSTIEHEVGHVRQIQDGRWYPGQFGRRLNELECYNHEKERADHFGLSPAERDAVEARRRDTFDPMVYNETTKAYEIVDPMPNALRMRTMEGDYTMPAEMLADDPVEEELELKEATDIDVQMGGGS